MLPVCVAGDTLRRPGRAGRSVALRGSAGVFEDAFHAESDSFHVDKNGEKRAGAIVNDEYPDETALICEETS